jgi:hypothetical protein
MRSDLGVPGTIAFVMLLTIAAVTAGCAGVTRSTTAKVEPARWREVTWKCEDKDPRGHPVGPVILSNGVDAVDYDADWHTRAEARAIARDLHARLTIDC